MKMREIISIIEDRHVVRSPVSVALSNTNFQRWFAGSKIVDHEGKPMVVYHGTAKAFEAFEVASIGDVFGDDRHGFFFTNNTGSDMASGYALQAARASGDKTGLNGAQIVPVFVSIKNPYTFEDYAYGEGWSHTNSAVINQIIDGRGLISWFDKNKRDIVEQAIADGHDGIFLYDPHTDIGEGTPENLVVAFRPEQIKSVFAREFNPNSTKLSEAR